MPTKRPSLSDVLSTQSRAPAEAAPTADGSSTPSARPQPVPAERRDASKRPRTKDDPSSAIARVGMYIPSDLFQAAKSAYLADFDHRPDAETSFSRWVSRAVLELAQVPLEQRDRVIAASGAWEGAKRTVSFLVNASDITAADRAIAALRQQGIGLSRSQFGVQAIQVGVARAQQRAGGSLPPAPERLPHTLHK